MFNFTGCIYNAIIIYITIMGLVLFIKPKKFFEKKDGKMQIIQFGCGENKSIVNIHILSACLAIVIYFVFALAASVVVRKSEVL